MKITPFEAKFDTILKRFYLMMTIVIFGGFTGQIWMVFFALPLFLMAILGLKIEVETGVAKQVTMNPATTTRPLVTGPLIQQERGRAAA